jgi:hypothetical protein
MKKVGGGVDGMFLLRLLLGTRLTFHGERSRDGLLSMNMLAAPTSA